MVLCSPCRFQGLLESVVPRWSGEPAWSVLSSEATLPFVVDGLPCKREANEKAVETSLWKALNETLPA